MKPTSTNSPNTRNPCNKRASDKDADKEKVAPAKGIAGFASNLLATGLILLIVLVVGRELIPWWRTDRPAPVSPPHSTTPTQAPVELGTSGLVFGRQDFHGSQDRLLEILVGQAREALTKPRNFANPKGAAEQRMLDGLAQLTPVSTIEGRGSLFQLSQPRPIVAAIYHPQTQDIGGREARVVFWGLGLPVSGDAWSLVQLHIGRDTSAETENLPQIDLPKGAVRTLAMQHVGGGRLVGFTGPRNLIKWQQCFDQQMALKQFVATSSWREVPGGWHARYGSDAQTNVDVHISESKQQQATGLILIEPATE